MPTDVRKYYKRGTLIQGGRYPAFCKGLPLPHTAMALKKRPTPTNNLKEIAARLEAARVRLAEIAAMVRRK